MNKKKVLELNEQYETKVKKLLEDLSSYSFEQLNLKPSTGGWSVMQNLHHLILSEETSMRYIQKKLSFNPKLTNVGLAEKWRGFVVWAYLSTPFKFKAPAVVGDENLPDSSTLQETQEKWLAIRLDWKRFFQDMPEDLANKTVYKHIIAGKLGWAQMLGFYNVHFDRHLKQIRNTLKQI